VNGRVDAQAVSVNLFWRSFKRFRVESAVFFWPFWPTCWS